MGFLISFGVNLWLFHCLIKLIGFKRSLSVIVRDDIQSFYVLLNRTHNIQSKEKLVLKSVFHTFILQVYSIHVIDSSVTI